LATQRKQPQISSVFPTAKHANQSLLAKEDTSIHLPQNIQDLNKKRITNDFMPETAESTKKLVPSQKSVVQKLGKRNNNGH
jgi:hypothetical protein